MLLAKLTSVMATVADDSNAALDAVYTRPGLLFRAEYRLWAPLLADAASRLVGNVTVVAKVIALTYTRHTSP